VKPGDRWGIADLLLLLPVVGTLLSLWPGLSHLAQSGPWGPEDPWRNGDLAGAYWWWWAADQRFQGLDPLALLDWPRGAGALGAVIPNPLHLGLAAFFLGPPDGMSWNLLVTFHACLAAFATGLLARAAGLPAPVAALCGLLFAASPVNLHELAGGRPDTLLCWPGILGLAAWIRGGRRWELVAGLFIGLQGVLYLWHGAVCLGLAFLLRPQPVALLRLGVCILFPLLPYGLWLNTQLNAGVPTDAPPAGYTSLPLAALIAHSELPDRFRVFPLVSLIGLGGLLRPGRSMGRAALAGLLLCMGPLLQWTPGLPLPGASTGPFAWLAWALPPVRRLHHPIRAMPFVIPLIVVGGLRGLLPHLRRQLGGPALVWISLAMSIAVMPEVDDFRSLCAWETPPEPPYARVVGPGGPVVDLLGMHHRTALSLQTVHGRPIAEPLRFRREGPLGSRLEQLAQEGELDPTLLADLRAAGFVEIWVLPRFADGEAATQALTQALGPATDGRFNLFGSPP
jgi:hypothetical protein